MLGILGGMGPLATADFMQKLVVATPSKSDQNHIPMVIWSVPQIADRSKHIIEGEESPFPMLLNGVNRLKSVGASVIAIPCNTAHFWADAISTEAGITVLHVVDAVAKRIKTLLPVGAAIGLLATDGTLQARIYQNRIDQNLWPICVPDVTNQQEVMKGIRLVKSGEKQAGKRIFLEQIQNLQDQGAQAIILGCTEIPSVINASSELIDSSAELAYRCVDWYRANFGQA